MVLPKTPLPSARSDCPECGGRLSEPISGSVHCYRKCAGCAEEFGLDDPRLA